MTVLFLLYMDDLPNVSNKLSFYVVPDHTNIRFESDNLVPGPSKQVFIKYLGVNKHI